MTGRVPAMGPRLRRWALTLHVATSVGWLGSVAAVLSLVLTGLLGQPDGAVQASYVAAAVVTRSVVVPLCLASLVTGVVQSLGTPWGLARHYWVLVKLVLTVVATFLLLLHTQPIELMADVAARTRATRLGAAAAAAGGRCRCRGRAPAGHDRPGGAQASGPDPLRAAPAGGRLTRRGSGEQATPAADQRERRMSSTRSRASPNSIRVFSLKNRGFCTPA